MTCTCCRKREARIGFKQCKECNDQQKTFHNQRYRQRIEKGLCGTCGGSNETQGARCAGCAEKEAARKRSMREGRKSQGRCVNCPNPRLQGRDGLLRTCLGCWYKELVRRAVGPQAQVSDLVAKLEAQSYRCVLTGVALTPGINASLDHAIPRSRGGSNALSNLRWTSLVANKMKSDFLDSELLEICQQVINTHAERRAPMNDGSSS